MTLSISVVPLRLTNPQQDLAGMVGSWMDFTGVLSSRDCLQDLETIQNLRYHIAQTLGTQDNESYEAALQVWDDMHAYYNYLLECEERGVVINNSNNDNNNEPIVTLEWESALTGKLQLSHSLEWERANIIWNFATLEAYQASKQALTSKVGWSKAAQHLQNAASWLQHLPSLVLDHNAHHHHEPYFADFSPTFIGFWQSSLMAQSQRCVYESLACAPRPRHLLLAKLAAAAVPLYSNVEGIVAKDDDSPTPSLTHCSRLVRSWTEFARAYGLYMSCKAEYHQSQLSREKKQWGQELARLDLAYQYADACNEFCEQTPVRALQELHIQVDATLRELKEKVDEAERDNTEIHRQPVPTRQELTEIRGEKLVNIDQPLSKLLKPKTHDKPIFQINRSFFGGGGGDSGGGHGGGGPPRDPSITRSITDVTNDSNLRMYIGMFESEMDKLLYQLSNLAEERTESARKALATVNLPHSLTAYRQEQSGGGIPEGLWQRVHTVQQERRITQLKQELWELRDVADLARRTYQTIQSQLDFDLDSDRLFRQENPGFEGHDAEEVQNSFRQSLGNYDRLLVTAQEGDSVLLRRLEQLDTNPKYKLLQFQKSQLDRLLPSAGVGPNRNAVIDTSHLSRLLVELSTLFHEREVLLNCIREEIERYDIQGELQARVDPRTSSDHHYREAVKDAQRSFEGMIFEMQSNIEKQTDLLNTILAENEQFMMARERTNNSQSGDSCIVMIEDAIEEIDQLSKHLKEGKDFYNVVIPKLDKLQHQVGDVSARLTVERLEFDDKANRARQEEKDAMMAQKLSSDSAAPGSSGIGSGGAAHPPGAAHASMNQGGDQNNFTRVDDEKVATLVAMDFDPDKVVAALMKHNNNVDNALNELLSC